MAVLHSGVESGQWTVDNPKILLTHLAVVESMRSVGAIPIPLGSMLNAASTETRTR